MTRITFLLLLFLCLLTVSASAKDAAKKETLLNVSYDPTRELYKDFNQAFAAYWKKTKDIDLTVSMSHGGSGKQARAVIDGQGADVVTLALAYDVDAIADKAKLLPTDWQKQLPNNSAPYTSTIVFLVRKGNPKGIKDWGDLIKSDVQVITPNPKTSGAARWSYLAAWAWALRQPNGNEAAAEKFLRTLFKEHVPVLDSGARGATMTFVERGIGDVLLAWENEAYLAVNELGKDKFEIVAPPMSILAEPSVALVEKNAEKHGTTETARAYLKYLYSEEGQEIAAKHYYRPRLESVAAKHAKDFPAIKTFTIEEVFGSWKGAQKKHFDDGGTFDKIYSTPGK